MATSLDVARYIVKRFQERGDLITNLKLQKLLYYVQGWHLGIEGTCAFEGDFMAWIHGPVNYAVYQEYRDFRWSPITRDVGNVVLDRKLAEHVNDVLDVYGEDSAWELERRTHSESPWIKARNGIPADAECRTVISEADIREYFAEQVANAAEDQEGEPA